MYQARPLLTRALEEGNFDNLVDARLQKDYNPSEMSRMVACAAACVRHSARRRPRMSQVIKISCRVFFMGLILYVNASFSLTKRFSWLNNLG